MKHPDWATEGIRNDIEDAYKVLNTFPDAMPDSDYLVILMNRLMIIRVCEGVAIEGVGIMDSNYEMDWEVGLGRKGFIYYNCGGFTDEGEPAIIFDQQQCNVKVSVKAVEEILKAYYRLYVNKE